MKKQKQQRQYFSRQSFAVMLIGLIFIVGIVFKAASSKKVGTALVVNYSVNDPAFRESMGNLLGPQFLNGNRVQTLLNGNQIFPAMLDAIKAATNNISFENYIWETGEIGGKFKAALMERAKAGVKIHCIVDGMGTLKLKKEEMREMKDTGIKFVAFGREHWYKIKPALNHRTHRKLLIVDGKVGFIGGVCLGDKWMGDGDESDHWRDTHFRVEGPVVLEMQGVFADNWLQTTSDVLQGPDYFPEVEKKGNCVVQCFKSGPKNGEENARLAFLLAIAAAKKNIRLEHAYFVPDGLFIKELLAARRRGVEIEIIVPLKNDSKIGRAAARSRWGELLDAGVKFYQFKPALFHCKVMIVDDNFVTAGSVNFDNRSFRINDEANINVLDQAFAAAQIKVFQDDKAKSLVLPQDALKKRSWLSKCEDSCAGLFVSQL
ncbi:MAG: cardiolipin synthase [Verrucomicrobiota bacterium]